MKLNRLECVHNGNLNWSITEFAELFLGIAGENSSSIHANVRDFRLGLSFDFNFQRKKQDGICHWPLAAVPKSLMQASRTHPADPWERRKPPCT